MGKEIIDFKRLGRWVSGSRFEAAGDFTRSISFSPNVLRFATGGNDPFVRVWSPGNTGSWEAYSRVRRNIGLIKSSDDWTSGHTSFGQPRAQTQDGQRVATGRRKSCHSECPFDLLPYCQAF